MEANLLNYTWPVQLVAWSVLLLGEPFRRQTGAATAMTAAGAFLLIGQGKWPHLSAAHAAGYLFAILSGFFWSTFSVLLRWKQAYAPSLFVSCCAATVASLLTTFQDPVLFRLGVEAMGLTVYIGVVTVAIGYLAWRHAVKSASLQILGALCYLIPVVSTVLLAIVGRNPLGVFSIIGAGLVVAGAVVADLGRRARESE